MADGTLFDPQKRLEEAFYPEHARELRDELGRGEGVSAVQALREASDIQDEALLQRLAGLGIRAETLAALTMIPIVEVAWADGRMEEKERRAILQGAESTGIEAGSPSHRMLDIWTEDRPAPALYAAWRDLIGALSAELSSRERARLREKLVGRARAVAEAAGGILGIGSVSREERAVLEALEKSLGGE